MIPENNTISSREQLVRGCRNGLQQNLDTLTVCGETTIRTDNGADLQGGEGELQRDHDYHILAKETVLDNVIVHHGPYSQNRAGDQARHKADSGLCALQPKQSVSKLGQGIRIRLLAERVQI